jgi:hypothetical protein
MPTILIVAASPVDQDRLRLGAEVRDIRHALQRSRNRENWKIESNEAVTVDDLRRALLDCSPTVLHFSGHGGGEGGLCFEDANGGSNAAHAEPLARLLHHFKGQLKCVVLNACYSEVQAEAIRNEIDYVIGMNAAVSDIAATKFSVSFYDAVFAGTDFRTAFDLGCTSLDLNNMDDSDVPVFMTGSRLEPVTLPYTALIPEIERTVYAFCNSPFAERYRFTTTGEELAPILEKYYRTSMRRTVKDVRVSSMKEIATDQWIVEMWGAEFKHVYVKVKDRSVLIEWEATVGLWSIPPKTVVAVGPTESIVARVEAELSDYYNFEFGQNQNKSAFQSIRCKNTASVSIHGYVKKGTETHRKLMEILSDGNEHSLTLQLRRVIDQSSLLLIEELLSPTWLYSAAEQGDQIKSLGTSDSTST